MAPTDIVPMDVDGNPELSNEVMDVAGSIIQEYNLGVAGILALADALDQFELKDNQDQFKTKNPEDEPVTEDIEHGPKAKKMKALENPAPENELVFLNHDGEPEIDDPEGVNTNWEVMYPVIRDDPDIDKNEPRKYSGSRKKYSYHKHEAYTEASCPIPRHVRVHVRPRSRASRLAD